MITVGRIIWIAQRHLVQGKPWLSCYHSLQTSKPPACLTRMGVTGRFCPVRGKRILTKKPYAFVAKHKQDKVHPGLELIYVNNMHKYYFFCQLSVYSLLIPSLCACVYLLWTNRHNLRARLKREESDHPYIVLVPATIFAFAMLWFTNAVCRRSIIRMYHNSETNTYAAVAQRWNMLQHTLEFTPSDCAPLSKSSLSVQHLLGGNVRIKQRTFLIRDTDFRQPKYYNDIMGYTRAAEDREQQTDYDVRELLKKRTREL